MAYSKHFLDGINKINFDSNALKLVRNPVIASAYAQLQADKAGLESNLEIIGRHAPLPDNSGSVGYKEQLQTKLSDYQKKLQSNLEHINQLLESLQQFSEKENIDLRASLKPNQQFVQAFAQNFRDIRHLADTLSDAPSAIKQLQTQLYTEILFKLTQREQETQLTTLADSNIEDMVKEAISLYNHSDSDAKLRQTKLRQNCQAIAQMGIYELVKREFSSASSIAANDYQSYRNFIERLQAKLTPITTRVGISPILDNLSQYKNSEGKSLNTHFAKLENEVGLLGGTDWNDDKKLAALKERKSLLHALRFGQEDRREYAQRVKQNLAKDLFWARNIRDIELFTKGASGEVFTQLEEQRWLKSNIGQFIPDTNWQAKGDTKPIISRISNSSVLVKFACAFNEAREQRKALQKIKDQQGITPKNYFNGGSLIQPDQLRNANLLLKEKIIEQQNNPLVSVNSDNIQITFVYLAEHESEGILNIIHDKGGFGSNPSTVVDALIGRVNGPYDKMRELILTGKTLSEIESQLNQLTIDSRVKTVFQRALSTVQRKVESQKIDDLKLDNSEELLLRKLLELYSIHAEKPNLLSNGEKFNNVFAKLEVGEYQEALKEERLAESVEEAYLNLTNLEDVDKLSEQTQEIVKKAKTTAISSQERLKKLEMLRGSSDAQGIKEVFLNEYQDMRRTLNLSSNEFTRVEENIVKMAQDVTRLTERTQKGLSALEPDEEEAYFSAIHQIAQALPDIDIGQAQFKIKHSIDGEQSINIMMPDKSTHEITINLPIPLPYSLIKPPNSKDFIFSYGGSRGIVAPFEGLDEAYAGKDKKKNRFFTNARLLGVGQYGSVKEVESLFTGHNEVIKAGYVPTEDPNKESTFSEQARKELRTRPITARDDPLYRIETQILMNLTQAMAEAPGENLTRTQYWVEADKPRSATGKLYNKDNTPLRYQILTERAKGESFADTANNALNQYSKTDEAYHNPLRREDSGDNVNHLKSRLLLSQAIVGEAQNFAKLGFSHNDIKPENFLYKENQNGSYEVKYIDWATGGFKRTYHGQSENLREIFAHQFGEDLLKNVKEPNSNFLEDKEGRFVKRDGASIIYGVNPKLQILHGSRNGTLPYISPSVLVKGGEKLEPVSAKEPVPSLNTELQDKDPTLDDWALTAMIFGVCNRRAYFTLVKGRAVNDYVVPGILEADKKDPEGLKIVSLEKFNEFFACGNLVDELTEATYAQNAIMYIPSSQREGEPLHLYRRLEGMRNELAQNTDEDKQKLIDNIDAILNQVRNSVIQGIGLSKDALQATLSATQTCIKQYENFNNAEYQQEANKGELVQELLDKHAKEIIHARELLVRTKDSISELEVLCTYPINTTQQEAVVTLLNSRVNGSQLVDDRQLNEIVLAKTGVIPNLFKLSIDSGQETILVSLLQKISDKNTGLLGRVQQYGLLHYAAEQGMVKAFSALVEALKVSGATDQQIIDAMLLVYGPAQDQIHDCPHIHWASNCFHIAIRDNQEVLLDTILSVLTTDVAEEIIHNALHLCAVFGNQPLFSKIVEKYESLTGKITPEQILEMRFSPDKMSPYHLFLRDKANLSVIDWKKLGDDKGLAKDFLLGDKYKAYPLLIAAQSSNIEGINRLIEFGREIGLEKEEWQQFFTQTDVHGKNCLNYLLEKGRFTEVAPFLDKIKLHFSQDPQSIIINLLSNPHPVNPLRNFLQTDVDSSEKFDLTNRMLDEICKDYEKATPEQQIARLASLLVNKEWLVAEAQNKSAHKDLKKLLSSNDALAFPEQKFLFERLQDQAKAEGSVEAETFYTQLLNAYSLDAGNQQSKTLPLDVGKIRENVVWQRSDLRDLVALFRETELGYQEALAEQARLHGDEKARLEGQVGQLEAREREAEENLQRLTGELQTEKAQTTQNKQRIGELEDAIGSVTKERNDLIESRKELETAHASQVTELKRVNEEQARLHGAEKSRLEGQVGQLEAREREAEENLQRLTGELQTEKAQTTQNKQRIGELEDAIGSVTKERNDLIESRKELETAHASQVTELKRVNEEQARLHGAEKSRLEGQVGQLEAREREAEENLQRLTGELQTEKAQTTQNKQRIGELEDAIGSVTKERNDLIESRKELETAHASQVTELKRVNEEQARLHGAEKSRLEGQVGQLEAREREAEENLQRLTGELQTEKAQTTQNKQRIGELEDAIGSVTKERNDLIESRKELETAHASQVTELKRVNEEQARLHGAEKSRLEGQVDQLEAREREAEENLQRLTGELQTEKAQTTQNKQRIGELEDAIGSVTKERNDLIESRKELETAHASQVTELKRVNEEQARLHGAEKSRLEGQVGQLEAREREAEENLQRLTGELQTEKAQTTQNKQRIGELEDAIGSVTKERNDLIESRKELETAHASQVTELKRVNEEQARLHGAEKSRLEGQVDQLEAREREAEENLQRLTGELQTEKAQTTQNKQRIGELEDAIGSVTKERNDLIESRKELETAHASQVTELKRVNEEQARLHGAEKSRLEGQVGQLEAREREAEENLQRLTGELQTEKAQTTQNKQRIGELEDAIGSVTKERNDLIESRKELETAHASQVTELKRVNEEQARLHGAEKSRLEGQVDQLEAREREAEENLQRLTGELQTEKAQTTQNKQRIGELEDAIGSVTKERNDLIESRKELETAHASQVTELKRVNEEQARLHGAEKSRLEGQVGQLEAREREAEENLQRLTGELQTEKAQTTQNKQRIGELEDAIGSVTKERNDLIESRKELETAHASQVTELKRVNEEQARLHGAEKSRLEGQVDQLEAREREAEENLQRLTGELQTEKAQTTQNKQRIGELEDAIGSVTKERNDLIESRKELETAHASQVTELKRVNEEQARLHGDEKSRLEGQVGQLEAREREAEENLQRLTEELATEKGQTQQNTQRIGELEVEISNLTKERSDLIEARKELETAHASQVTELKRVNEEQARLHGAEKSRLEGQVGQLEAREREAEENLQRLTEELATEKGQTQQNTQRIGELEVEISNLTKERSDLIESRKELETAHASQVTELKRVNEEQARLHGAEKSRLEGQVDQLEAREREAEENLQRLTGELQTEKAQTTQNKQRIGELEDAIGSVTKERNDLIESRKELETAHASQVTELKRVNEEQARLHGDEKSRLEGQVGQLEAREREAEENIQRLTEELATEKGQTQQNTQRIGELEVEISNLTKERNDLIESRKELETAHASQVTELKRVNEEQARLHGAEKARLEGQVDQLEAREREKEQEYLATIEALKEAFAKVAHQKAQAVVTAELATTKDPEVLNSIINAETLADLINAGLPADEVNVLKQDDLEAIKDKASERLDAIFDKGSVLSETDSLDSNTIQDTLPEARQTALTTIDNQISTIEDEEILNRIANSSNKEGLRASGLNPEEIDALNEEDIESIRSLASRRLEFLKKDSHGIESDSSSIQEEPVMETARQQALAAIENQISSITDEQTLKQISNAENKNELIKAGLDQNTVNALNDEDLGYISNVAFDRSLALQESEGTLKRKADTQNGDEPSRKKSKPEVLTWEELSQTAIDVSGAFDNCFFHAYAAHLLANELPLPDGLFNFKSILGEDSPASKLQGYFGNEDALNLFAQYQEKVNLEQNSTSPNSIVEKTLVLGVLLREWSATQFSNGGERFKVDPLTQFIAYLESRNNGVLPETLWESSALYEANKEFLEYLSVYPDVQNLTDLSDEVKSRFENYFAGNRELPEAIEAYWLNEGQKTYFQHIASPNVKLAFGTDIKPVFEGLNLSVDLFTKQGDLTDSVDSNSNAPRMKLILDGTEGHYFLLNPHNNSILNEYVPSYLQYREDAESVHNATTDEKALAIDRASNSSLLVAAILPKDTITPLDPFDLMLTKIDTMHQVVSEEHKVVNEVEGSAIEIPNYRGIKAHDRAVLAIRQQIQDTSDSSLLNLFKEAKTKADLIQLAPEHVAALIDDKGIDTIQNAAKERLAFFTQQRIELLTSYSKIGDLRNRLKAITKDLAAINKISTQAEAELKALSGLKPIHWFNPGFEAVAQKHANEMAPHFLKLAANSNGIYLNLLNIRKNLEEELELLSGEALDTLIPSLGGTIKRHAKNAEAIDAYRAEIQKKLIETEKKIELHEPLHRVLNGDPEKARALSKELEKNHTDLNPVLFNTLLIEQGIVKTLEMVADKKHSSHFVAFSCTYEDFPTDKKSDRLGLVSQSNTPLAADSSNTTVVKPNDGSSSDPKLSEYYKTILKVAPDHCREYTLLGNKPEYTGSFIEERPESYQSVAHSTDVENPRPELKLTVNKFPQKPASPASDEEIAKWGEACVQYAFSMASQILAGRDRPSPAHPVILEAGKRDPEAAAFIWTALMMCGKKLPHMKFDDKAIKLRGDVGFDPKQQQGFYGFSKDSYYKKYFEKNANLNQLLQGISDLSKHKLGHQKGRLQAETDVKKTNNVVLRFKNILTDITNGQTKPSLTGSNTNMKH